MQEELQFSTHRRRNSSTRKLVSVVAAIGLALALTFGFGVGSAVLDTLSPVATFAQDSVAQNRSVGDVAEDANPAVVTITTFGQFSENSSQVTPYGTGSGFIIDNEGHVVTNHHVVQGGSEFEITFEDGRTADATLVGSDAIQDVAVLKIDLETGFELPGTLAFGDSDSVRPGDEVVAIGTPWGEYANSVTTGEVNGVERNLDTGSGYHLPHLIQHDADIYPGNSGGPLVNLDGEVVGINVAKAFTSMVGAQSLEGPGFAIASNDAKSIVEDILADGTADRSYLGIIGRATPQGVEVMEIQADGPAEEYGLQAGDLITGIEGVSGDEPTEALDTILFEREPGDTVVLEVLRDEEQITVELVLGERPGAEVQ